jgi:hypothetical protein
VTPVRMVGWRQLPVTVPPLATVAPIRQNLIPACHKDLIERCGITLSS